ncbi:MAG TPA: PAAT family amino acid ABC transporter substrate-binding protein [Pseudomonas sp.]|nr:PAAT family amino acid ABC transporter substrate-binding protein [Pseudomonas sp.]
MRKGLLLLLLSLLPLTGHAQREVTAWTYHLMPPFILDLEGRAGLSFDLLALLNQHKDNRGRYHFQLDYLPRKRLDIRLNDNPTGLVLWVNPGFFGDLQGEAYHWTPALLHDQQDVLSRTDRPFDYRGPESLHAHTLGGVLGHRYPDIQADIDRGLIHREDVAIDRQNLDKLLSGRLDQILIPHSTVLFFIQQLQLNGRLHVSPTPLKRFERQLLVKDSGDGELSAFLDRVIAGLPRNLDWQALLRKYGLD